MSKLKYLGVLLLIASDLSCCNLSRAADPLTEKMNTAIAAYQARDFEQAFEAFSGLAEAGQPRAQTVLAIMYRYGEGIPADPQTAFTWYRRAAESGYAPAQYSAADMLLSGEGITQDRDAGMHWMQLAADAGHERAVAYLDRSGPVAAEESRVATWSRNWDLRLPNSVRFDPPASAPSFRVLLGEHQDVERLQALWRERQGNHPNVLSRLVPSFLRDLTAADLVYQLQAGSFATEAEARAVCDAIVPSDCTVTYQ